MQPNTFDLKAAREIALDPNFYGNAPYLAANLNDALDEIERLQADIITHDDAWHNDRAANAKRIAELEAALQVEKSAHEETKYADSEVAIQAFSRIAKQRAALKKLGKAKRERGKALVEERAHCYLNLERNADIVTWDLDEVSENEQKRLRYEAREQLRREDKL